jgi:uncharacterized membrane protein (DUF2068 family)
VLPVWYAYGVRWGADNRYELLSCAIHGHFLVGTDAARLVPDDPALARTSGGLRWHRCLRCDAWIPRHAPATPAEESLPARDEIALPLRGPALRDRYVLRLIAFDRAIHVVVLTGLAIVIFFFLGHRQDLLRDYDQVMNDLTGGSGGPEAVKGFLGHFRHFFLIQPGHLYEAGLLVSGYAALEATEMVGLWFAKRWAEYLTFLATVLLIPLEVYELSTGISTLKALTFVINVAIAAYLLLAKRLFGLRGGHRVVVEHRRELSGWSAIDRATPALSAQPFD